MRTETYISFGLFLLATANSRAQAQQIITPAPPVIPQTPEVKLPGSLSLDSKAVTESGKKPISVQEAILIALSHQPQIGIASGNFSSAQGQRQQVASGLNPQFSGNGGYANNHTIRGSSSGSSNSYSVGANVSQLLYDFGRTRDEVRRQSALERAAFHLLSNTKLSVTLLVKQSFYDLVQGQANVTLSEADVSTRQRQLDEAQARVSAGIGAPSDLLQAKTNLAEAAITLSTARDTALTAQVTLAEEMGIDPRTPITPMPSSESSIEGEGDIDALVKLALTNRPDILAAREQVKAAAFGVSATLKNQLPTFSVSAGVGGNGPNDPLATQSATLGINVSWTFADGGLTAGEVKSARGSEQSARSNLVLTSQSAISEVSRAFLDLKSARQRQELAEVGVSNAQELVRISEGRYEGGLGLFLDITNAQSSLVSAQRSLTQAQGDIQRALARLRSAVGLTH